MRKLGILFVTLFTLPTVLLCGFAVATGTAQLIPLFVGLFLTGIYAHQSYTEWRRIDEMDRLLEKARELAGEKSP